MKSKPEQKKEKQIAATDKNRAAISASGSQPEPKPKAKPIAFEAGKISTDNGKIFLTIQEAGKKGSATASARIEITLSTIRRLLEAVPWRGIVEHDAAEAFAETGEALDKIEATANPPETP